ncbi:MAG: UDP-N-acetylglucosamine 1-carboxyvinyltransferase [Clostridia bacterium]|nr:UDP-N-acetylglucosamine 1-carboxyvinyltransferase [Clostridia bacterium]
MDTLLVTGGFSLEGAVAASGAKNSALALLAAAVLADGEVILENIPVIKDVLIQIALLEELGIKTNWIGKNKVAITSDSINCETVSYSLAKQVRASNLFLGALLAKTGRAVVPLPGGCNIGARPMDLHIKGLQQMGADIKLEQGYLIANGNSLQGAKIYLDFPSVGATENLIMAATRATGTTVIENAAKEPEIVDLASFLNTMGARVRGAGTDVIRVIGGTKLTRANYPCIPDRIEAGTLMIAAAITRGKVRVDQVIPIHLQALTSKLQEAGVKTVEGETWIEVDAREGKLLPVDVKTLPYPGFATDLQSPILSFLATIPGTSTVTENVFEGRYRMVDELKRMGAKIKVEGRTAVIQGTGSFSAAQVRGHDLRGAAGLVLAALAADGQTEILGANCIYRGYEDVLEKLTSLGAKIEEL